MKVLVLNSGSSSVKFKVFDVNGGSQVIAKGSVERIGLTGSRIQCACCETDWKLCQRQAVFAKSNGLVAVPDHGAAIDAICKTLLCSDCGVISDITEIVGIGHRVVHGGEEFTGSVIIDDDVLAGIRKCSRLAPLHNPPALEGIEACEKIFSGIPQVAVFDTAFHHTIPPQAYRYPVPKSMYTEYGVRKYGFHGTSHHYVALEAAKLLGQPLKDLRLITCHLGNGSSITAVDHGKSVETSMGLTPLGGVMMGTRCGDMDPYIPLFMIKEMGMTADEVDRTLNKQSGFEGVCGHADVRDCEALAAKGDPDAQLALEMFAYRVARFTGSYAMVMNGVDAIVFTGGIGERGAEMRSRILKQAGYLGVAIDEEKNARNERDISQDHATVRVLVIPTDEELMIARETARLVTGDGAANRSERVAETV
ncbi:MAG TPA: acetate kinase [Candidatus Hydrogenedentes bacterium]|nr:acetate kinase [Candidatus Hydrogenedentota bacterium]HOS01807.1 acetate kinase [Candidatus Hydrogenedentota bacterium]